MEKEDKGVEVLYLPKDAKGELIKGDEYRSSGGFGSGGELVAVAGQTFRYSKEKLEQLRRDFGKTFKEVVHTKTSQTKERKTTRKATKTRHVRGLHTK